jgi:hypothetical protein
MEQEIARADPTVWKMLRLIARTREERKKSIKSFLEEIPLTIKSQRLFYIMCCLYFTTDNRCNTPIHMLLTDVVYSHGGTTELVQVMNRLGMISSEDTHACYVDHVVRYSDNTCNIDPSDTVVATLDNLDFLQSNAAVYCGDQHRSWHGTTVQILQPKPPTQLTNESVSNTNTAISLSLPPAQKKDRRSRTAKERKAIRDNVHPLGSTTEEPSTSQSSSSIIEGKTIKDFLVDDNEKGRADTFTQQAFRYISDRVQKTDTRGLQEYLRVDKGSSVVLPSGCT